jgi:hypothetical protein
MKTWAVSDGIAFPQMPALAEYGFFMIKPMVCNVKLHGTLQDDSEVLSSHRLGEHNETFRKHDCRFLH